VVEKTLTKEINGNKRKAVPLLWDNWKRAQGDLRNLWGHPSHHRPRLVQGRIVSWNPRGLDRPQDIFPLHSACKALCGYSYGSNRPSSSPCWQPTLVTTCCWFNRHAEFESYEVMVAYTKMSKENLRGKAEICYRARADAGRPQWILGNGAVGVNPQWRLQKGTAARNMPCLPGKAVEMDKGQWFNYDYKIGMEFEVSGLVNTCWCWEGGSDTEGMEVCSMQLLYLAIQNYTLYYIEWKIITLSL
jgi:hypothetical protein